MSVEAGEKLSRRDAADSTEMAAEMALIEKADLDGSDGRRDPRARDISTKVTDQHTAVASNFSQKK